MNERTRTVIPKQPGSHYTNEQRRAVIADYFVTGNITKTADMNNMPRRTVGTWIKSEWGVELLAEVRHEKGEEYDANLTKLIDSAFAEAQDRIDNGDFRVTKDGKLIRVPMGGKELVILAAVFQYKQLRIFSRRCRFQGVHFQWAKNAAELNLLVRGNVLVAENQNGMFIPQIF